VLADEVIEDLAGKKIKDGDVILTYAKWVSFPELVTDSNLIVYLQVIRCRKSPTGRSRRREKVFCHCD
jgi:translation initiation factor eIF-2B subunit delta